MELIPCFTLYRCLYELAQSAFIGNYQGTAGTLTWSNLRQYGFAQALAIMAVEWAVFLALGLYFDQVGGWTGGQAGGNDVLERQGG